MFESKMDYISSKTLRLNSLSTPETWHPSLDMLEKKATTSPQLCFTTVSDFGLISTKP